VIGDFSWVGLQLEPGCARVAVARLADAAGVEQPAASRHIDGMAIRRLPAVGDLAVVRQIAERIYVLYLGEIVEHGPAEDVIGRPQHPYTKRLIDSIPR